MIDLFTSGGIIIDNVVTADGQVNRAMMGGNAVYSAAGAKLWLDRVGIVGVIPSNYPMNRIEQLAAAGVDTSGVTVDSDAVKLTEWFFYRADGSRADHLHAPDDGFESFGLKGETVTPAQAAGFEAHLRTSKQNGRSFGEFRKNHPVTAAHIPAVYEAAQAIHLAPNRPAAQRPLLRSLAKPGRLITLDPGHHAAIMAQAPLGEQVAGLAALLPSEKELALLAPGRSHVEGLRHLTDAGVNAAVVKLGGKGSLLRTASSHACWRIAPLDVAAIDPTGAGDAYCGGFLAGLLLTGDPLRAACYGTVSASFAIEAFGPFHLLEASRSLARERLALVSYTLLQKTRRNALMSSHPESMPGQTSTGWRAALRAGRPAIIAALHLPDLGVARATSMAFLEDYVLTNAAVFAKAGVPSMMLQDQTRQVGPASPATIAVTAALGRLIRREFPTLELGIIVQAHDAVAPLAIAHAAGATFVRLKIFVGAAMTMEGPRSSLAVEARTYRHDLRRDDIAILADVFDRTSVPLLDVPPEEAAQGAVRLGADGLILTGGDFADSLERVRKAKAAGVRRPILIGGGVTETNVTDALGVADGAIVSTSLMRDGGGEKDLLRWDAAKTQRFMDRANTLMLRSSA